MIKLNGLIGEDLPVNISNGLAMLSSHENDAPLPGVFPDAPDVQLDAGEILKLLAASIAQMGPQNRALELRFQKQELVMQKFERRLVALEGKVDGLHGIVTEAVEKLNHQSRELNKLGSSGGSAGQIGPVLEQAVSNFGVSLLSTLDDALATADQIRAMRQDVQEALERITVQVNGIVNNG